MVTGPTSEASISAPRGRPRDPETERRILDMAMALYAAAGWSGLSFDVIAREAGVGKNALYRRWRNKEELLTTLLAERWLAVGDIDTGNLRDDLIAFCMMLFDHYAGTHGNFGFQLHLDVMRHPEVGASTAAYREGVKRSARQMVRHAIARGELPANAAPTMILDILTGSVMSHVAATPPELRDRMTAQAPQFVRQLVALLLNGIAGAPGIAGR
ncbi:TetR/AcrR family transcriptional regulator [Sphingopyxis sp.]|uniref:TetR/AcrR family transcriptional regulator n=1 Tax=Sphingopyxis sp. TaxID=1908224 RepID=UPI003D6CBC80